MSVQQFERALARSAARAGATLAVESHRATAWHSATFSGDRHEVTVHAAPGVALDAWTATLPALDLGLPGYLLADLRLTAQERSADRTMLRIEGLTVACE